VLNPAPTKAPQRLQPDPESTLAINWQAGDLRAADELLRICLPRLHAFVRTRVTSAHEAEDVTQEILSAVSRQIQTYKPEHPFAGWLYGIARRKVADSWRQTRYTEPFEESHGGFHGETPARICQNAEEAGAIWRQVFARLPETQATALWLKIHDDLPIESIASALQISVSNVKVSLFRARQTLAQLWKSPTGTSTIPHAP
jgi:RNA polymerase sigma factor (sigma-70 family)